MSAQLQPDQHHKIRINIILKLILHTTTITSWSNDNIIGRRDKNKSPIYE